MSNSTKQAVSFNANTRYSKEFKDDKKVELFP